MSSQDQAAPTESNTGATLAAIAGEVRVCRRCILSTSRTHAVPGEGNPSTVVMFIGEGPGFEEDRQGRPFVGRSGQYLNSVMEEVGIQRSDVFITNVVKCRPPNNRLPRKGEIGTCTLHYLYAQIEMINPKLIVLLGGVAAKTLLGVKNIGAVRGRLIEKEGRKYLVGYHPAVRFYREDLTERVHEDFARLKEELQKL
jgi:DNA polymerase